MNDEGKKYNITDGELLLTLEVDPTGGFAVTSPMEPELITQGETVEEAFAMARDALKLIHDYRQELAESRGVAS